MADKASVTNFDPKEKVGARLTKLCEENGVIARVVANNSLCFSPPLVISKDGHQTRCSTGSRKRWTN